MTRRLFIIDDKIIFDPSLIALFLVLYKKRGNFSEVDVVSVQYEWIHCSTGMKALPSRRSVLIPTAHRLPTSTPNLLMSPSYIVYRVLKIFLKLGSIYIFFYRLSFIMRRNGESSWG